MKSSIKSKITTAIIFTIITFASFGQKTVMIDGDKVAMRDTLGGKEVLVSYIERGLRNQEAIWLAYDRRPGEDRWILEADDRRNSLSDDTFIDHLRKRELIFWAPSQRTTIVNVLQSVEPCITTQFLKFMGLYYEIRITMN